MTYRRKFVLVVAITGALLLTAGVSTVAAQSAPDCSTVSYSGDGTTSNPYEVGNVDQLQCIDEQGLDENYVQVSDIDASGTSSWNGGDGFEPIGGTLDTAATEFSGTYEGQEFDITGLTIDRDEPNVGLFFIIGEDGEVKNTSLVNADITGLSFVGGIASANGGTISESSVSGSVGDPDNGVVAGGIVAENGVGGTIEESYSTASIDGASGGIVGGFTADNAGTIEKSYTTGSVDGITVTGGFTGTNTGTITESYAAGSVTDEDIIDDPIEDPTDDPIDDPLSVSEDGGAVEGSYETQSGHIGDFPDTVGGFIGFDEGGTVTDSYWDTDATGQSGSGGGATGLTTSQMTGSAATTNMGGFDFTETWETVTDPDDYPILAWETEDSDDGGDDDPPDTGDGLVSIDAPATAQPDGDFDFTVEMTDSSVGEVAVESSDFDVSLSVVDNDGDSIGAQTDMSVEFLDIGSSDSTYTLSVDVTGGSEGDTGTITAATGGNIGDSGVDDQESETFTLIDATSSPVEDVSDELWTAVTQNDNDNGLSLADLGNAIQEYQANPGNADIDGVSIGLSDLGALIQHYQNEVV
ncbi:MAG: hypothetical protein U5J64_04795 [Halobacteriales archaeon]|nr:hypothetical protein [Halobacteriales archaeon]